MTTAAKEKLSGKNCPIRHPARGRIGQYRKLTQTRRNSLVGKKGTALVGEKTTAGFRMTSWKIY